ncbi:hypothetical protein ACET3X_007824 [Alternaria dauci]|uniref:Uncharacterized protein n=1 Tax=Alternaria dauci TaxID=48095 RepID=A0ABR3UD29_9PLEO
MLVHCLFIGLLGFAGLVIAVPTPQPSAMQPITDSSQPIVEPDENRALVSPVSNCITPDSGNHFLNICTADSYGNAFPNRFIDTCVQLSPNVAHHVTIIVQKAGLMCKFYDDSNGCSGNVRYIARTIDKSHRFEPPAEFGNNLKYALCRRGNWKRDVGELALEARDVNVSLDATTDQPNQKDTNEVTAAATTQYLLAKISSDITSIELKKNSLYVCTRLSDRIGRRVTHTTQLNFAACQFFTSNCDGAPVLTVNPNIFGYIDQAISSDIGSQITHVKCGVPGFPTIGARDENTSPNTAMHTAPEEPPLMAKIISGTNSMDIYEDLANRCQKLNNHVANDVKYTSLRHDIICAFYKNGCGAGNKPLIAVRPGNAAYFDEPMASDVGQQIKYVKCGIWNIPDATAMPHGSVNIHVRDGDASAAAVDAQIPELPALEQGQLRIGEDIRNKQIRAVINALNNCVSFPTPQYPNSTRTLDQSGLTVCKYYAATECAEPLMLDTLNVNKEDWKIRSDFAQRINSAKCTIFEPVAPTNIQDPMPESTLGQGQLRIGEDVGDVHLRKVVSALDRCVDFPAPMYPDSTRFLEQSGRSECLFYSENACLDSPLLSSLNPEEKDLELPVELAQQISSAQCTVLDSIELPPTSIGTRSEPLPQANAKGIQVTVDHSISTLSTTALKVADLYICNDASLDPAHCTVLHTLNQCVAFPELFAYRTKIITQAKGSLCKYYTEPGCLDGAMYFDYISNPTQDARLSGWGVENLAGVWCAGTGAASMALPERQV